MGIVTAAISRIHLLYCHSMNFELPQSKILHKQNDVPIKVNSIVIACIIIDICWSEAERPHSYPFEAAAANDVSVRIRKSRVGLSYKNKCKVCRIKKQRHGSR